MPVRQRRRPASIAFFAIPLVALAACSSGSGDGATGFGGAGSAGVGGGAGGGDETKSHPEIDAFDVPIAGATDAQKKAFIEGDSLFEVPLREADGLGPLYTRSACGACHEQGLRGAGSVQKMAVVLADGVTPSPDQSQLPWGNTLHPLLAAGAKTPILAPDDPSVRVTIRVGPPILGRGYMEAIAESEILRVEAEQKARKDAIHGRVNHVVYPSEKNPDPTFGTFAKGDMVIGRFGLKLRQATLDDFVADALQGDMGITSPLRPLEIPNPDGLTDDAKPGIDATADEVNARAMYMRLTAIPRRVGLTTAGRALFDAAKCSACHVPTLKTRPDYPIAELAGIDAPIYTDMLLHDMGDGLADGIIDGQAGSRDWRTAPLIGLRFNKTFLHDGRALTIEEAILLHDAPPNAGEGSEAAASVALYKALSAADRSALLAFVSAL